MFPCCCALQSCPLFESWKHQSSLSARSTGKPRSRTRGCLRAWSFSRALRVTSIHCNNELSHCATTSDYSKANSAASFTASKLQLKIEKTTSPKLHRSVIPRMCHWPWRANWTVNGTPLTHYRTLIMEGLTVYTHIIFTMWYRHFTLDHPTKIVVILYMLYILDKEGPPDLKIVHRLTTVYFEKRSLFTLSACSWFVASRKGSRSTTSSSNTAHWVAVNTQSCRFSSVHKSLNTV